MEAVKTPLCIQDDFLFYNEFMEKLGKLCKLMRYNILTSTTKAGSGHVTSSLSAVELMATLFYKYFRFDFDDPKYINNDRLIFSKGHASPLFYSLYSAAGKISEKEIYTLRQFDSVLEGHPTKRFKYTEVPTGSLGQGLSVGIGMALSAKLDKLDFLTYVLLGDGETAEGQVWEALEIAADYKLNNLLGIIDVNRLGQTGETLLGHNISALESRIKNFGWRTYVVNDGHNLDEIDRGYQLVLSEIQKSDSPYMILAKTIKGKGVSFIEDKEGWHGRVLDDKELKLALGEIGEVDKSIKVEIKKPEIANDKFLATNHKSDSNSQISNSNTSSNISALKYRVNDMVSSREAYGDALKDLGGSHPEVVALDCDVGNSTFSDGFKKEFPERYFEMFIAEQNMVSAALGMSERGKVPFISTFSAFLERAFDQIRMAHLSGNHLVICGSHSGVSIGEDGPSQMGLEDLALFRSLINSTVFYPSDGVSAYKLTQISFEEEGLVYIRTARPKTPVIYKDSEEFEIGGSKTLRESDKDEVTIVASGITVHEAIKAHKHLKKDGINVRVIDAYCIKPIDANVVLKASKETKAIITVEDHYITGGLGDAVLEVLAQEKNTPVYKLGVTKIPRSGKPEELLEYEEISAKSIIAKIKEVLDINTSVGI